MQKWQKMRIVLSCSQMLVDAYISIPQAWTWPTISLLLKWVSCAVIDVVSIGVYFPQRCIFAQRERVKYSPRPKKCRFPSPLEPFWLTMTSQIESSNATNILHCTKNEQFERKIIHWRLLLKLRGQLRAPTQGEEISWWVPPPRKNLSKPSEMMTILNIYTGFFIWVSLRDSSFLAILRVSTSLTGKPLEGRLL